MDFNNVPPVDVKVRDLSLSIESSPSILERIHIRKGRLQEDKRILQSVSLDVPSGSLMAIIGASGSGKVFSFLCFVDKDVIVEFDGASNGAGENEDEREGGVQRRTIEGYKTLVCDSTGYIIACGPADMRY